VFVLAFVYNSFIRIIRFIFYGLVDNTCSLRSIQEVTPERK